MPSPFTNFPIPTITLSEALAAITAGAAVIYYVSPSGSDTANDGLSPAAPFQTIAKVNTLPLAPGDAVLFQGGQTFSGAIVCPASGTSGAPITFGSYGGGQATISSGTNPGFKSISQSGIVVRDLTFAGSASTNDGVYFSNLLYLTSAKQLQSIACINLNISGYGRCGIVVAGASGSGYDDILIEGCNVSSCCHSAADPISVGATAGICLVGGPGNAIAPAAHTNAVINNCQVSSCPGTTDNHNTGSGIQVGETQYGVVSNCQAINNGASANNTNGGGPSGIWAVDSTSILIEHCRSINQQTANGQDGDGYDLDGGCVDCEIRDCYEQGSASYGYLIFSFNTVNFLPNQKSRLINCVSIGSGVDGINIANDGSSVHVQNVTVSGCSVYTTVGGTTCLNISDTGATGNVLNCNLSSSAAQTFVSNSSSSIVLSGILEFANAATTGSATTVRLQLEQNTNFYVSATGSDSHSGLSSGAAWATVAHAMNTLANAYDGNGFSATINIGAGSFATFDLQSPFVGFLSINILGAGSASTTINNANFYFVGAGGGSLGCSINIDSVTLHDAVGGAPIGSQGIGVINVGYTTFDWAISTTGSAFAYCYTFQEGASVAFNTKFGVTATISGNSLVGFWADGFSSINILGTGGSAPITVSGTPAFSSTFAQADAGAVISVNSNSGFSGSATGKRFNIITGGKIGNTTAVGAMGPTFFPGNAAGFCDAVSSYDGIPGSNDNYQQPISGFTVTMNNADTDLIIDPSGTLAAGTVKMAAAPMDGQRISIRTSQIITSLAINGNGATVAGYATGTLALGGVLSAIYRAANTTWYF